MGVGNGNVQVITVYTLPCFRIPRVNAAAAFISYFGFQLDFKTKSTSPTSRLIVDEDTDTTALDTKSA